MSKLAILGGAPVRTAPFPSWPVRDEREAEAVAEVARSGQWGFFSGTRQFDFASQFAAYQDVKYGFPVMNATCGLEIALKAAGVGAGDEVIVPGFTWVATASCALTIGAVPIFVDIDPGTYCLDPKALEAAITPRTKAVIPVHLYSCMADMDAIMEIANRHGLVVIEDCAHAHGARWRGKGAGSWGHMGVFSFQEGKTMSSGEGGLVVTNDKRYEALVHAYANCGRVREGDDLAEGIIGWNYRMTEWQAAILLAQFSRLEEQTAKRNEAMGYLDKYWEQIDGLAPMRVDVRQTRRGAYVYTFRYDAAKFKGVSRSVFVAAMQREGIPLSAPYTPVYRSPLFVVSPAEFPAAAARCDYAGLRLPVTEHAVTEECLSMRHSLLLSEPKDLADIVTAALKVRENLGELAGKTVEELTA
ncbi:MAG: DegT/DnrJ/EryC1/StrS family aminotransferase [Chloroflexi bacterium]|nr:DegT/DnrJ/EryC1/StrS family aminotransferase [Chloroflexota bacterium]